MSTTSGIALRSGDTYETIYCHWDGHPDTMLPILRGYYNSFELASKLISFGDASSIDKNLEPAEGETHDFMHPAEDTCVFYHRDRGEERIGLAAAPLVTSSRNSSVKLVSNSFMFSKMDNGMLMPVASSFTVNLHRKYCKKWQKFVCFCHLLF